MKGIYAVSMIWWLWRIKDIDENTEVENLSQKFSDPTESLFRIENKDSYSFMTAFKYKIKLIFYSY